MILLFFIILFSVLLFFSFFKLILEGLISVLKSVVGFFSKVFYFICKGCYLVLEYLIIVYGLSSSCFFIFFSYIKKLYLNCKKSNVMVGNKIDPNSFKLEGNSLSSLVDNKVDSNSFKLESNSLNSLVDNKVDLNNFKLESNSLSSFGLLFHHLYCQIVFYLIHLDPSGYLVHLFEEGFSNLEFMFYKDVSRRSLFFSRVISFLVFFKSILMYIPSFIERVELCKVVEKCILELFRVEEKFLLFGVNYKFHEFVNYLCGSFDIIGAYDVFLDFFYLNSSINGYNFKLVSCMNGFVSSIEVCFLVDVFHDFKYDVSSFDTLFDCNRIFVDLTYVDFFSLKEPFCLLWTPKRWKESNEVNGYFMLGKGLSFVNFFHLDIFTLNRLFSFSATQKLRVRYDNFWGSESTCLDVRCPMMRVDSVLLIVISVGREVFGQVKLGDAPYLFDNTLRTSAVKISLIGDPLAEYFFDINKKMAEAKIEIKGTLYRKKAPIIKTTRLTMAPITRVVETEDELVSNRRGLFCGEILFFYGRKSSFFYNSLFSNQVGLWITNLGHHLDLKARCLLVLKTSVCGRLTLITKNYVGGTGGLHFSVLGGKGSVVKFVSSSLGICFRQGRRRLDPSSAPFCKCLLLGVDSDVMADSSCCSIIGKRYYLDEHGSLKKLPTPLIFPLSLPPKGKDV